MNISYPPFHITNIPPPFERLGHEFTKASFYFLIPVEMLYFSIYFHGKGRYRLYEGLSAASVVAFLASPVVAPVKCAAARCLQNLAIGVGIMKILDLWARRHSFPVYRRERKPPGWLNAFLLLTELRYESFTPNHVRVPRNQENFNEPLQLGIHIAIFAVLQSLPQVFPTILAFEVQLAIYILWTSLQLCVRYKSSPALFGPLYLADSITGFWSETWHNAFASPCTSLAYSPLRYGLPKLGIPVVVARSLGVMGAFTLMATFHVYALAPMLSEAALFRIGMFFVINGMATVVEAAVWGKRKHWVKAVLAWIFETSISTWTASGIDFPNGLSKIDWREVCSA